MKKTLQGIWLSAGDLSGFISCHHLTYLSLAVADGRLDTGDYRDPLLAVLQERGLDFEAGYLRRLEAEGRHVVRPEPGTDELSVESTRAAMDQGAEAIYQASLRSDPWQGRADFLIRVDKPSLLGNWSYEIVDAKLARETKAGTILQLCLYAELLASIQGTLPEYLHVITPEEDFKQHTYRSDDFMAYYRLIKSKVLAIVAKNEVPIPTYPEPCAHCAICGWWAYCDRQRRNDDHLSLVAGLSGAQAAELRRWDIHTLTALAGMPLPLPFKPSRGAVETFIRLRDQARVQLAGRIAGKVGYELLDIVEGKGLSSLPEPSSGDLFFDMEGDPFVGNGGMEYLFGWVTNEDPTTPRRLWALNPHQEKAAFESFIDEVIERSFDFPGMHIYHFSPYEPSALKRLMGRYATREDEVDTLLRAGRFVDLHAITRQAIRAGIESYSLKELEQLHDFEREFELRAAAAQLREMERRLERNDIKGIAKETKEAIEQYNFEDCRSTWSLRNLLEKLRSERIAAGIPLQRPELKEGAAGESVAAFQQRIRPIYDELMTEIPVDPLTRSAEQQARWLLANLLEGYRREKKALWWEYFRLLALAPDDLLEEKEAISGLAFTGQRRPEKKSTIDMYQFPVQECEMQVGDTVKDLDGNDLGEIVTIDKILGRIEIKKGPSKADLHPIAIFRLVIIPDKEKEEAIIRLATWVAAHSMDEDGDYRAARDLLLGYPPRTTPGFRSDIPPQQKAVAWARALDRGVLPIQGPPGTGKSHTAAEMILALIRDGKKVGITALSHKVIVGLMEKVIRAGEKVGVKVSCMRRVSKPSEKPDPGIAEEKDYDKIEASIRAGKAQVVGGTAWLWAREQFKESIDVLVVDEAGQLSLIDTLAVAQAATNLVLLGDPQQLKQPQQGSHPEGTDVSALEHVLQEHQTIPQDRGILLDVTWRMHPAICSFVSELFYENRLQPLVGLERQLLSGATPFRGAGLWYVPVHHEGNQSSAPEEVAVVRQVIDSLLSGKVSYQNAKAETSPVTASDIKVIAPFNAQVSLLTHALPVGVAVGTVDKFQGQEAPIVLFSMATSRPEDAPRGMEFLYSPNRLNVAVSRARATFILVSSPRLFEPDCRNVRQMKLANAYCRYMEQQQNPAL